MNEGGENMATFGGKQWRLTLIHCYSLICLFPSFVLAEEAILNLGHEMLSLKQTKTVHIYWGLSGPKGGSYTPYANNRALSGGAPQNESQLKLWSCAYTVSDSSAIEALLVIMLKDAKWRKSVGSNIVKTKYVRTAYGAFQANHLTIDFVLPNGKKTRMGMGNDGRWMRYTPPSDSSNDVYTYILYNFKNDSFIGTKFFNWLLLHGGTPTVGDLERLSVQDCDFWQRRAVYSGWDGVN